jgi:hypothetical protein
MTKLDWPDHGFMVQKARADGSFLDERSFTSEEHCTCPSVPDGVRFDNRFLAGFGHDWYKFENGEALLWPWNKQIHLL